MSTPVTLLLTRTELKHIQGDKFETARFELHALLGQASLLGVPLLVVRVSDLSHVSIHSPALAG